MGPVLGVEGGGSHRQAVLADTSGQVLGIEAAAGVSRSCVRDALNAAGLTPGGVGASVFALACKQR